MNPFSTGPAFPNLAPTINNFVDNLVRLKTHQQDIDLRGRQLQQQQGQFNLQQFGTETPQPGMQTLHSRQVATQEQEAAKRPPLPEFQQVIKPSEVLQKKVALSSALGEGAVKKVFAPVFEIIDEVAAANPNTTKWDAYENAKAAWAGQRDEVVANAEKYLTGPEFQKLKPAQQEAFTEIYNTMKYDKTGDTIYDKMLFKNTVESKQAADANSKAALKAAEIASRMENERPDRRYVAAKTKMYMNMGLDENTATMKAVEDLYAQEARKAKEGKFAPVINTGGMTKISSNVATNPDTGKDEYLMTDGSFSGRVAAARPTNNPLDALVTSLSPQPTKANQPGTSTKPTGAAQKDKHGYSIGQTVQKNGVTYKYIGNDKWQKL